MKFYGVGINSGKSGIPTSFKDDKGQWKSTKAYSVWSGMLKRCYSPKKKLCYFGVTVCENWLDYQNFAAWYIEQNRDGSKDKWQLDKDTLNRESKCYSPENCRLVPTRINLLIRDMHQRDTVQGVSWHKRDGGFRAYLKDANGNWLEKNGFKTEEQAFLWYKPRKEKVIKEVAEQYKDVLDEDIYQALLNYKIPERFDNDAQS